MTAVEAGVKTMSTTNLAVKGNLPPYGLTGEEAEIRFRQYGFNAELGAKRHLLLAAQCAHIVLLLRSGSGPRAAPWLDHKREQRLPGRIRSKNVIFGRHLRVACVSAFEAGHGRLKRLRPGIILELGVRPSMGIREPFRVFLDKGERLQDVRHFHRIR